MMLEIPRNLIEELKNRQRKRTIKTILREHWTLIEDVDKALKTLTPSEDLPILVSFILQNFLTTVNLIVSPKRVSMRKQRKYHENEKILEFEEDLRAAQKDWKVFLRKYEEVMKAVARVARQRGKVDFRAELWQRTGIQKTISSITHISRKLHSNTVYYIPPTRYIFSLIVFILNWTLLPVFNVSRRITWKMGSLKATKTEKTGKMNGTVNGHANHCQNGNGTARKPKKTDENENWQKFHSETQESQKILAQKELEFQEKSTQFQKEIRARLEVQEKRLLEEFELFEEEKEERRRQEDKEFRRRIQMQSEDFEELMAKIEEERKVLEDEEQDHLLEVCELQDKALLNLFNSEANTSRIHWTDHEDYWNDRLQVLRNGICAIRADYWPFEGYLKQFLKEEEGGEQVASCVRTVYKIESAAFGRTVTRAKTIIENEQDFFESLTDKYHDDRFLRILMKSNEKITSHLETIILELWNVAMDRDRSDSKMEEQIGRLRSAVMDVDPYSIPTTWRLKGICNAGNAEEEEENGNGNGNGHGNEHF